MRNMRTHRSHFCKSTMVEDTRLASYWIMVLLGTGALWPYNTLVNVPDVFDRLFPDVKYEFVIPVLLNITGMFLMFAMVRYGGKISSSTRITWSLAGFIVCTIAIITSSYLSPFGGFKTSFDNPAFYVISLAILICGMCYAVYAQSIFGLAGAFPALYTQALMSGNGASGLCVALLRLVMILAYPTVSDKEARYSAIIFFIISTVICVACLVAFFVLKTLPFAQHHMILSNGSALNEKEPFLNESNKDYGVEISKHNDSDLAEDRPEFKAVWARVWKNACVIFTIMFTTFLMFPGLTSKLTSTSPNLSGDNSYMFTNILFVEFNFFDVIARALPARVVIFSPRTLWIPTLFRLSLYPCFILCSLGKYFTSDAWIYILMALFSISNGYLGSSTMMATPTFVSTGQREQAAFIMILALNLGILVGSQVALILALISPVGA